MPKFDDLENYVRGWLIGNFEPSIIKVKDFEICITQHLSGELSDPHYHTESIEINVVSSGEIEVNGRLLSKGGIFIYEAFEISDVKFITDTSLVVIRLPSSPFDKVKV
jgi:hypothetical protein